MTAALIMAGGKSSRMRASGNSRHKAQRIVCGKSLLEWNVRHVLAEGVRNVFVAVNVTETELQESVSRLSAELANSACAEMGGEIQLLVETEPLGTIGIAAELRDLSADILVLNVDNLTTLGFREMIEHHQSEDAAMTIATHKEGFRVPLGEVVIDSGEVREYREKPLHSVRISSGAYVLSARACSWIPRGERTDVPAMIPIVHARKDRVVAFPHESHWIDVNDDAALEAAERLVTENLTAFETDLPPT